MTAIEPAAHQSAPLAAGAEAYKNLFARMRRDRRSSASSAACASAPRRWPLLVLTTPSVSSTISADFGHRSHETRLLELFPSLESIRHNRSTSAHG